MRRERGKSRTQGQAAARAGMSVHTIRRYERRGRLPSQLKQPRTYRTRASPFNDDWAWIVSLKLTRRCRRRRCSDYSKRRPGGYQDGQMRTLQRQIAAWRGQYGPGREVIFPQVHEAR